MRVHTRAHLLNLVWHSALNISFQQAECDYLRSIELPGNVLLVTYVPTKASSWPTSYVDQLMSQNMLMCMKMQPRAPKIGTCIIMTKILCGLNLGILTDANLAAPQSYPILYIRGHYTYTVT